MKLSVRVSCRSGSGGFRRRLILLSFVAACLLAPRSAIAESQPAPTTTVPCPAAGELARFERPLVRVARKLVAGKPIKIVAIGSSSTAGAGATTPEASYPSRLAVELVRQWRWEHVTVVNRGVNGEEAADMIARFKESVINEKPDLVLWQMATNALLRDSAMSATTSMIREGIRQLKAANVDIVLVDPQYAPRVIAKAETPRMVEWLGSVAKEETIDVFRRWALMRNWRDVDGLSFETFISDDGLHLNDWSYACWAKGMATAIAEAATRPTATAAATAAPR